jgi:alkylation response protein AidB-like acyl-CoA dehydrogenase
VDFGFSQEQTMLRDLVRELLRTHSPASRVRQVMATPAGYDPQLWRQLSEVGLPGLAVPTSHGGQGWGMVELAIVFEEFGRAVYPGPFLASTLATLALNDADDAQLAARYLPALASGDRRGTLAWLERNLTWGPASIELAASCSGDGWSLSGTKQLVPFASSADVFVVAARTSPAAHHPDGLTLFAVDANAAGLEIAPVTSMDPTARDATVTLHKVPVGLDQVLGDVDRGWNILEPTLLQGAVLACAEMLGAARAALEASVAYARTRHQFGQPIGSFQAVKHQCADMLVDVENAYAATYYAAWALAADAPDARLAASTAKAFVSDAARRVCGSAIQVHGGIGFTWEYDLHLWFKRAKHLEPRFGDADTHRQLVLDGTLAATALPTPVLV